MTFFSKYQQFKIKKLISKLYLHFYFEIIIFILTHFFYQFKFNFKTNIFISSFLLFQIKKSKFIIFCMFFLIFLWIFIILLIFIMKMIIYFNRKWLMYSFDKNKFFNTCFFNILGWAKGFQKFLRLFLAKPFDFFKWRFCLFLCS